MQKNEWQEVTAENGISERLDSIEEKLHTPKTVISCPTCGIVIEPREGRAECRQCKAVYSEENGWCGPQTEPEEKIIEEVNTFWDRSRK